MLIVTSYVNNPDSSENCLKEFDGTTAGALRIDRRHCMSDCTRTDIIHNYTYRYYTQLHIQILYTITHTDIVLLLLSPDQHLHSYSTK